MRILSIVSMLLGAASAMIATGCYSPSLENCQFSCTGTSDCPDSMTCINKFCHTSATDTSTCRDDNGCPPVPSSSSCGAPILDAGMCVTVCEATDNWDRAKTACTGGLWTFAVLDPQTRLDGLPPLTGLLWVSLTRGTVVGMEWQWVPAGNTVKGWDSGEPLPVGACGVVNANRKLATAGCTEQHKFLCAAIPAR
jgi:hypothetical protein